MRSSIGSAARDGSIGPPRGGVRVRPKRRQDGLMSRKLDDDVLIYDLERHRAHCLNATAALVFDLCDGARTVDDLGRAVGETLGVNGADALVELALDRLAKAHLLEK